MSVHDPARADAGHVPQHLAQLFGQDAAQRQFVGALAQGRLHHAWLLTGPRGVGKATLAWKIAHALLAAPAGALPRGLDTDPGDPTARRMAAGSEPGLAIVRPGVNEKTGRQRDAIVVDDIRRLSGLFRLSAADGGQRVAIIDAADDLNVAAANALLKLLEEPPEGATLLLVAHQPALLLPTIRSRCRTLALTALGASDLRRALHAAGVDIGDDAGQALQELSGGSVGMAVNLMAQGGLALYADVVALLNTLPNLDRMAALRLAETAADRKTPERFEQIAAMLELALTRLARSAALGAPLPEAAANEARIFARLAPDAGAARHWAETAQTALARARQGRAVNLDAAALVLDMLRQLRQTAIT